MHLSCLRPSPHLATQVGHHRSHLAREIGADELLPVAFYELSKPLYVAEELGQLKSAEFASVRHAERECGDEALTAVEGDSGLVSATDVVGCVCCIVLDPCVIPMSIIRMYDASDEQSCSECWRAAPRCTTKCG